MDGSSKLDQALAQIKQRNLDGLIIYSNGVCSMLRPSYFHYFSGLKPLGANNAVILAKSGEIVLLVEPEWDIIRASRFSWIKDIKSSSDFVKDLVSSMQKLGLNGSIGLAGAGEMPEPVFLGINRKAKIVMANDIVEELARTKTDHELEIVRKTARIADEGFKAFMEFARVGIREFELSAEVEYAMRAAGADDNFNLFASGTHAYAMHSPTDKRLAAGDIVLGEITPVCEGQFIQLCRTVVLGEPDNLLAEKYSMLVNALKAALEPIKAGAPAASISRNMNKVISDAGYAEYCYPPYMRARAHGLGVGSIAPGGVIDDNIKSNLESQQVIIVHPNQYLPETGYLACGETVLVTESGFERLAKTETKLHVKKGV